MRKYGKYEKRSEGVPGKQAKVKNMLLQTYFTGLICLIVCVSMFIGTSYAWFTSEAKNEGNEIYIGTLDAKLEVLKDSQWVNVEENADVKIFDNNIRWEPGYTTMETIKISNEGNLSFRYALSFTDGKLDGVKNDEELIKVAQCFTVYVHADDFDPENGDPRPNSFADIEESVKNEDGRWRVVRLGKDPATLADILTRGFPVLSGNMEQENEADTYVIALHMLETAGEGEIEADSIALSKNLMGKKINLNVKLTAYQRTHEQDAFNADYDLNAHVTELGALDIEYSKWIGEPTEFMTLDVAYQFQPVESYEESQSNTHKKYIADFTVWADKDVPANSIALAGYYDAWCRYNEDRWIVLQADVPIAAGEKIRLVESMGDSFAVTYEMLCEYGNDGIGFLCGVKDITGENAGTTITVELRLHEVVNGEETENYIVAGHYEYTFPQQQINP
ncbi:MAG: hypothetical protein IIU86_02380 [Oscillospiraceae bacterium]|nr:hypothetical protein [Oscillospiraceae bacterium]